MSMFQGVVRMQVRFKTVRVKDKSMIQKSPLLHEVARVEGVVVDIKRTVSGLLPVYREYRNGRSKVVTIIRTKEADKAGLVKLFTFIPPERISIRLGSVEVVGDYLDPIRKFLTINTV